MADVRLTLQKIISEVVEDPKFFVGFDQSYKKRVTAQKIVYLLQSRFGMERRWGFNWYIAGPYSPSLAQELYSTAEQAGNYIEAARTLELKPSVQIKAGNVKALLAVDHISLELDQASWLELLASIDYVAKQRDLKLDDPTLIEKVLKAKPKFSRHQIEEGISCLRQKG